MEGTGYTEPDTARRHPEPAGAGGRAPFAKDRARVLHCAALRRLAGTTQVVGPGEHAATVSVPRTRLTHSLEVAQIGREIAARLGADPDVVDTAGLAHDIGHPPFGHNGERALGVCAASHGGFEANAQTLRILTRLEPKVLGTDDTSYGLNLTRACLDATVKYPWPRAPGTAKFGVYAEDAAAFRWLRAGAPEHARCLEAQIMDWSDDVAYSVHDVEDAVLSHRVSLGVLADTVDRADLAGIAARHFTDQEVGEVEAAADELLRVPAVAELAKAEYDGSLRGQIALKALTSELVGRFASAAAGTGGVRHRGALTVPAWARAEVALLKAVALRYVMSDPRRLDVQAGQRDLVTELFAGLSARGDAVLDPLHAPAWRRASDDTARTRVVVDQIAALTDAQAVAWHHELTKGGR